MGFGKQLWVTLVENGTAALLAHYVLVRGGKVLTEGECSPKDLPYAPEARAVFFSRSGYFDRVEAEVRNARTLSFHAHRIIESAVAFNEPFRVRFASANVGDGRYRLDLAAAADADIRAALETLPTAKIPFSRLVLVETAIASLVGMATGEPVGVLWMRGDMVIGTLVEKGMVLVRSMDHPTVGGVDYTISGGGELAASLERVWGTVSAAAHRMFPDRQVTLALALGELVGKGAKTNTSSRALEDRLAQLFPGSGENSILHWPELYGLATVPACYSLLESGYQEEALVSRYASWAGAALLACGAASAAAASWQYFNWHKMQASFAGRNTKLDAEYASLKKKLPSQEHLAALEQRVQQPSGESVFRMDIFLAWVSHITPKGALIRRLRVTASSAVPGGAAVRKAPVSAVSTEVVDPILVVIEWDVPGNYTDVEKSIASLLLALGTRTRPASHKLEYKPGGSARFTTMLTPLPSAFKE